MLVLVMVDRLSLVFVLLATTASAQTPPAAEPVAKDGAIYRYQGTLTAPRPTIFTFALSAEDATHRDFSPVADALLDQGWLSIALDLPAHGRDVRPTESADALFAWRQRSIAGEDWIGIFVARVKAVIDQGIAASHIDPRQIAIVGYSRGGFLALHVAAADPRITAVAAIQPVTDLLQVHEWHGVPASIADPLSVRKRVPAIASRPVWLSIGWQDTRVGTQAAIEVALAGRALDAPWTVLQHPERDGAHTFPATVYQQAAVWVAAQKR